MDHIQGTQGDQIHTDRGSDLNRLDVERVSNSPSMQRADIKGNVEVVSQTLDLVHDAVTQEPSSTDSEQVVRTRAGRVRKKVNRLIESMVQKPFGLMDFAGSIHRKSRSLLALF